MKIVLLIRHSESIKNVDNRFGDPEKKYKLTLKGEYQSKQIAQILLKKLKNYHSNEFLLVAGSENRSFFSAKIISSLLKIDLKIINKLNPIFSGDLKGLTESKAKELYPGLMYKKYLYRLGKINGFEIKYPNGENVETFQKRIIASFHQCLNNHIKKYYIFISHQSTISAILSYYKSLHENRYFYYYFKLDPCYTSQITFFSRQKFKINYINVPPKNLDLYNFSKKL